MNQKQLMRAFLHSGHNNNRDKSLMKAVDPRGKFIVVLPIKILDTVLDQYYI